MSNTKTSRRLHRMGFYGSRRGRNRPRRWGAENAPAVAARAGDFLPKKIGMAWKSLLPLTSVRLRATLARVRIRNFVHKGLKRFYEDDVAKGVPPDTGDKLRKVLAFLDDMEDPEELRALPSWKVHTLTGDRKGTWSLSSQPIEG
jgi:toxin HigB-1